MKKRIACLLLALVMLVGLIPAGAVTASAATGSSVSEAGIRVIKDSVGFHKNAYVSGKDEYGNDAYAIGYGTPSVKGATITEAQADKLLRDELTERSSIVSSNISTQMVQNRFDALVWYSYTEGTGWTQSAEFKSAVSRSLKGSEFVNILCAWDIPAAANMDAYKTTLTRRMAIANLYLNGVYSSTNTGTFGYTIFDAGTGNFGATFTGTQLKKRVQAFDCSEVTAISVADPFGAKEDDKFMGWYNGNELVTGVGTATSGKTLTARWQAADTDKVSASYSLPAYTIFEAQNIPASENYVAVRQSADDNSTKINDLRREDVVTVVAEKLVNGIKWLELSIGGWVRFGRVSDLPTISTNTTVTITDDYVNIREQPSVTANKVGVARRGETRVILMTAGRNNEWGYCSEGWIFLAYTDYSGKVSSGSVSGSVSGKGTPGTVSGADQVNVRTAAGVGNPVATRLAQGTAITVYEQTTVNGASWGRIDQGWIAMQYVQLSQQQTSQNSGSATVGTTLYVSSSTSLNVRSGPGTEYSKIGALVPGTAVVILQKQVVNGITWGLIDQGWINMNYVSAGTASSNGSSVYGVGGTVVNCATGVNIRSAAGTTNALVGVAAVGSRVTVTELTEVNGFSWGHIDRGWVCMDYIQLDHEFKAPTVDDNSSISDIVTTFEGYPAITTKSVSLQASASAHANSLMTLNSGESISIISRAYTGSTLYGQITIGSFTGWVDMSCVQLQPVNAKVTAERADVYKEASTRSECYTSLTKGTYVTVGNADGTGWQLADGILWGLTQVTVGSNTYSAWINMANVTMFKDNTLPTGVTTLNGVGYLTGSVKNNTVVYADSNGDVTTNPTNYTLVPGHRVNILARNYVLATGVTYGKVSVGSVTGWINMADVALDEVQMQVTAEIEAYETHRRPHNRLTTIGAGHKITILDRLIVPFDNEINNGISDYGYVYVDDEINKKYWVILDEGKLTNIGSASVETPSDLEVQAGVVVAGKTVNTLNVYEETSDRSDVLLQINPNNNVTILNWMNVGNTTWGKVQVGSILGWVKTSEVSFANLKGIVNVESLNVYARADKDSSVQVYHVNANTLDIDSGLVFDGATLWGKITVAGYTGWIDLANVTLTTGTTYNPELVIATGKINNMYASADVMADAGSETGGAVTSLPKGTAVNLTKVEIVGGVAWWKVDLGGRDGWIKMDCLTLNSAVARITGTSQSLFTDLTGAQTLYTLYSGETVTVQNFIVSGDKLYGEVAYGDTTGWLLLCDSNGMTVSMNPGSTGSNLGGSTNNNNSGNTGSNNNNGSTGNNNNSGNAATEGTDAYIVCNTTVNVRSGAGVGNTLVTTLANGTAVKIYEQTTVLGKLWARIDQGWVCMDYVKLGSAPVTTPNSGSGSVSIMTSVPAGTIAVGYANEDVKIRSGSGLGYGEVGTIKKNNSVVIYEKKLDGGMSWGRTDQGWVCLSYLTITGIGVSGSGSAGTIGNCGFTANVRGSASSNGALMAKVMVSSRVQVYEQTAVGAETWGRTDLGWISMAYITLDSAAAPVPTPTESTPVAGTTTGDNSVG